MKREPRAATAIAPAALCVFLLACCLVAPAPAASAETGAGAAVHASPWASAAAEARVLADRILSRESDDLLPDGARQRALGHEIKQVLALVRRTYPAMADVPVRRHFVPSRLLLGLEGSLLETIADVWGSGTGSPAPPTGHAAFDALNATLGLRSVRPLLLFDNVILDLDERVNLFAARRKYLAIEGVAHAHLDQFLGDGPDIEAAKEEGTWYLAFHNAWGDCPAGCIFEETSYFTVTDGRIAQIDPERAGSMDGFAAIFADRLLRLLR